MPGMKGTMHEFKEGTLHSGSKKGPKVKSRKQAIAIGLAEDRKAGKDVPPPPKKKRVGSGGDYGYGPKKDKKKAGSGGDYEKKKKVGAGVSIGSGPSTTAGSRGAVGAKPPRPSPTPIGGGPGPVRGTKPPMPRPQPIGGMPGPVRGVKPPMPSPQPLGGMPVRRPILGMGQDARRGARPAGPKSKGRRGGTAD